MHQRFLITCSIPVAVLVMAASGGTVHAQSPDRWKMGSESELDPQNSEEPQSAVSREALERLAAFDPEAAQVVELRFFGGLTEEETAVCLGVSSRTVRRSWQVARLWLRKELGE